MGATQSQGQVSGTSANVVTSQNNSNALVAIESTTTLAVAVNQNDLDNSNVLYDADFELEEEKVNTSFSAAHVTAN